MGISDATQGVCQRMSAEDWGVGGRVRSKTVAAPKTAIANLTGKSSLMSELTKKSISAGDRQKQAFLEKRGKVLKNVLMDLQTGGKK